MASEAERQAARVALNGGMTPEERQAKINAIFAPYQDGLPVTLPTPAPAKSPDLTFDQVRSALPSFVTAPSQVSPGVPQEIPTTDEAALRGTVKPAAPAPVAIPPVTVTPGPARPMGTGGGPGRPTAGPAPWLRNAVSPTGDLRGAPSEADLFNADFEQSLRDQGHEDLLPQQDPRSPEEIRASAQGDPGLKPHTPGVPETADEKAFTDENIGEQFAAGQEKIEAGEEATEQTLARHRDQLDKQEAIDAENARRQADRMASLERMEGNYRQLANEMQNQPIDSQRLWNKKNTGEKVLGKLALFLGTVGFGMAGAPNLVWEGMQADIDRDIDEQKENRAFKSSKLAAEGTLYGMAKSRFEDEALTDAAMREAAYGRMAKELENFEQTARTPERKAAIRELRAIAEEKVASQQLQRRARQDAYDIEQARLRRLAAAGPDPMAEIKRKAKLSGYKATIAENEGKVAKAGREAQFGPDPDPKAATTVRESAAATAKLEGALRRLDEIQGKSKVHPKFQGTEVAGVSLGSDAYSQYESEVGTAKGLIGGTLANSGTLNAGEAPKYEKLLSTKAGRAQLRKIVQEGHQAVVDANKPGGAPKKFAPTTEKAP